MELERGQRLEYGCPLRRVCCQADGLAYASTMGWMRVEPQQRDAHPTEDRSGSMNLPTSVEERVKEGHVFEMHYVRRVSSSLAPFGVVMKCGYSFD